MQTTAFVSKGEITTAAPTGITGTNVLHVQLVAPAVEYISPASAVSYVAPVQPCTLRQQQCTSCQRLL